MSHRPTRPLGLSRLAILFFVTLSLLKVVGFLPQIAKAEAPWNCAGSFRDLDSDGKPDLVVLSHCQFATGDDMIYVYDQGGNLDDERDWWEVIDFSDDLWAFDAGSDGMVDLIIDFYHDGESSVADIYDRQGGAGVPLLVSGNKVAVKGDHWTVRVIAPDGWWVRDAKVNFNLQILVDGPVVAIFDAPRYVDALRTDGFIDFQIFVRDIDHDGRPDYELIQAPAIRETTYLIKTFLIANEADSELPIEDSLFWPYLGTASYGFVKPYQKSLPPIQMEWKEGRIAAIGEFTASHGGDYNWYVQSTARFGINGIAYADFENPFGFYDVANDRDGYPELCVRVQYYDAYDPYFAFDAPRAGESRRLHFGRYPYPIANIRYSWDQDNNTTWDYKVDITGRHSISTTVEFPEFSVRTVPYAELPYWVTEKPWDTATFVAVENVSPAYWTSEGIYEWGASPNLYSRYIPGVTKTPPFADYTHISQGFRGEYNFNYAARPYLYFSPVDRKLHLLGAQRGIWNLDDAHYIEYENLNDDPYIDQWTYLEDGEPKKMLIQTGDFLIYGDEEQVILIQVNTPASLFETLPPRNHDEWKQLGDKLKQHEPDFAPNDFRAMLAQFSGSTARIFHGTMSDFRFTEQGFRFILKLKPGFRWESTIPITGALNLSPGAYLVQYGSGLTIEPLTPPFLSIRGNQVELETQEVIQLNPVRVSAMVENQGLQDVHALRVRFYAEHNGERHLIDEMQASVLSHGNQIVSALWTPLEAGIWTIRVKAEAEDEALVPGGETTAEAVAQLMVHPTPLPGWVEFLALAGEQPFSGLFIPILVGSLAMAAVALFLLLTHESGMEEL